MNLCSLRRPAAFANALGSQHDQMPPLGPFGRIQICLILSFPLLAGALVGALDQRGARLTDSLLVGQRNGVIPRWEQGGLLGGTLFDGVAYRVAADRTLLLNLRDAVGLKLSPHNNFAGVLAERVHFLESGVEVNLVAFNHGVWRATANDLSSAAGGRGA